MKNTPRLKAFTLLEVLIATSVFVIVMVFALGTVGENVGFQAKLKSTKEVNIEMRRTNDLITRDIRGISQPVKIELGDSKEEFSGGLALLLCTPGCQLKHNLLPSIPDFPATQEEANTLVLGSKNSYKIYASRDQRLYFTELPFGGLKDSLLTNADLVNIFIDNNIISSSRIELAVKFSGFSPGKTVKNRQQPYVQMMIESKTKNFDQLSPKSRASATLRTLTESRFYQ